VSDLSRLLGDVYGASTPPGADTDAANPPPHDPPAPPVEDLDGSPAAPGWADEAVLDEAFAEWVPGPPSDASAEERDILADVEPAESVATSFDIDAWLGDEQLEREPVEAGSGAPEEATATLEAETFEADAFVPAPVPQSEPRPFEPQGPWTRTSDDLLPPGRRGRRLSLTLRR
jgi:hypothetical protein